MFDYQYQNVDNINVALRDRVKELETALQENVSLRDRIEELELSLDAASASLLDTRVQYQSASQEVELTLMQLHQVQEELEYYFLRYQDQAKLLTSGNDLSQRMLSLVNHLSR